MAGFTKLHAAILDSSIWLEDAETRIVWITMLAMADADGIVSASVGGLAHRARVSHDACRKALASFLGPDPDSRDGTTGERLEKVPGGWLVLNHANYRDIRTSGQIATAERVRRHRERRASTVTGNEVTGSNAPPASASASASSASVGESARGGSPTKPDDVSEQVWADWIRHRRIKRAATSLTAITTLRKQAAAAGMTLEAAMAHCVSQGHQGFYPPDQKKNGANGKPAPKFGMRAVSRPEDYSKPENSWESGAP